VDVVELLSSSARRSAAERREFFGGIWFKIFSERGPCRPLSTL
jgi:hypothetical protein